MNPRRKFLTQAGILAAGALRAPAFPPGEKTTGLPAPESVSLCGPWWFRTDSAHVGEEQRWYESDKSIGAWHNVRVPHTWQVDPTLTEHRGVAWYRRVFDAPSEWQNSAVRIEFEAVFHTATIWVNGELAGEHVRKGYTAFVLDITHLLRWGSSNAIAVRVDNAFSDHMVPRGRSSDWAHDGGIYRPVRLLITPKMFVEQVDIEALPNLANGDGKLTVTAHIRNTGLKSWTGRASFRVIDDESGLTVLTSSDTPSLTVKSGAIHTSRFEGTLPKAKLWHFGLAGFSSSCFSAGGSGFSTGSMISTGAREQGTCWVSHRGSTGRPDPFYFSAGMMTMLRKATCPFSLP